MNEFYNCARGPKTNFDSLTKYSSNWIPKLERYDISENGCWEWNGALNDSGYGVVSAYHENDKSKLEYVHRLSYFLHKGEIPSDKIIDHICNNSKCLNPDHLRLLDHEENAVNAKEIPTCGICGTLKVRTKSNRLRCNPCSVRYTKLYKERKRASVGVDT